MKLQTAAGENLVFILSNREKLMLCQLLGHYPRIPESYHLAKSPGAGAADASHKLIEEALAEQRQENKRQLQALLDSPDRFKSAGNGWHLTLSRAETDWLLQVLNDVRVGSWIQLGSPDPKSKQRFELNASTAASFWSMELCGHFQAVLLQALMRPG